MRTIMNADGSYRITLQPMEFECLANVIRDHVERWEELRADCYANLESPDVRFLIMHYELTHNLYRTITPCMKQLDDTWESVEELVGSMLNHGPVAA